MRVSIIRGAGKCFSAGYDLGGDPPDAGAPADWFTSGEGQFQRQVTGYWTSIWDLAKPVIAQVHSYCLAGGSELATGCDVVYVSEDAKIGYPAVRFGTPDLQYHAWMCGMRKGMEMMLTGDPLSGAEAVECGFATRVFPTDELEERTLEMASRIAQIPSDIAQINKRTVHQAMEIMGFRDAIKAGIPLCTQATRTETFQAFMADRTEGLTSALQKRDAEVRRLPHRRGARPRSNATSLLEVGGGFGDVVVVAGVVAAEEAGPEERHPQERDRHRRLHAARTAVHQERLRRTRRGRPATAARPRARR